MESPQLLFHNVQTHIHTHTYTCTAILINIFKIYLCSVCIKPGSLHMLSPSDFFG